MAVVDGNSLMHRAFHALPETMTAPDGRPTNAVFGFVSMLLKFVQELSPDGVVVAFDCGKPAFRIEALEQYKVHRAPTPEALKAQFPMVKEVLGELSVPVVEVQGWEADDILGTLAVRGASEGFEVMLVTGDRDAFQLVNDSVRVVSTKKGVTDIVIYGPAEVAERYGIAPAQVADFLGLKGDTSDNIPGVAGIGEKTAAKLLSRYGTLDEVLAHADDVPGKLGENLREHADAARASRTVATIRCDVPLELDIGEVRWGRFDQARAARALAELRFTSLLERLLRTVRVSAPAERRHEETVAERATVTPRGPLEGADAWARLDGWLRGEATVLGVAYDDGAGESLFADRRDLAVAGSDDVLLFREQDADRAFARLLEQGSVSAEDVKSLLRAFMRNAESRSHSRDVESPGVEPSRLFDCGIAAYLLESNRSSYSVGSLSADYLSSPIPEPSPDAPRVASEARACAALAIELGRRLDTDGESARVFRDIEMPLVPVLIGMEETGVGLDSASLSVLSEEVGGRIQELTHATHELAGVAFNIDSPKQLAEVLFDKLGLPAGKRTKTGLSTDSSVLTALAPMHPIAGKVLEYRELAKLKSTYIDALPRLLGEDGRLHTTFNQTVAATGRLSSSNPNLQNIPVRTELGRRIRAAFVPAREADVIVSADYSQIELRILAHLSEDRGLIEAFTSGADFHTATAARVFGVPMDGVTAEYRRRAKAVNFGIVYGISAHGLADSLGVARADAQAMIDRYFAAYPGVREFLDRTVAEAHRDGFACTLYGRRRRIPELRSSNYNLRAFGERTAMNHPMQGTAADIMKLAMIEVHRRLREKGGEARLLLQVHDELVFEAPPDELRSLSEMVADAMTSVAELRVPLVVEVCSGRNWAAAK